MRQMLYLKNKAFHRFPFGLADVAVLLGVLGMMYVVSRVGSGMLVSFHPSRELPSISLDTRNLPYYAARSTFRMFLALILSSVFTLIYGYAAAKNRRAEMLLIPLLDVLQSVPVLGFLSVTISGFIALFPGSLLGLEAASVFAIFTSQAWNMAFSFYQSLRMLPSELGEAAALYRLSRWQRFAALEVPVSMIGLVWNAMMSFGGGWFFLAASEAISVLNHNYTLPGVGSYVAIAVTSKNMHALGWALVTMAAVIIIVDQLFWRPLVAWSDKFKLEESASADFPHSWVLDLIRASYIAKASCVMLAAMGEKLSELLHRLLPARPPRYESAESPQKTSRGFNAVLVLVVIGLLVSELHFVLAEVGWDEVRYAALLGLATFARVMAILVVSTIIWTPIGVLIGFSPRLARVTQPIAQFLASFPANFIFPFVTLLLLRTGTSLNWGSILLMALGTQWYILFNVIAGAVSIPTDLREMAANFEIRGWQLWRVLIIPGIFSAWVTGAITAAGGAWNASIVAEVVTWGSTTLTAYGLGRYITHATQTGDWPRIVLGVGMMSIYVVVVNRLLWRRLYTLASARYKLE
jgi:NitT/TauT family transport system permease protein